MNKPLSIYIPTRGRVNNQKTWHNLPDKLKEITTLVVDAKEFIAHAEVYGEDSVVSLPPREKGIAYIRQTIIETCNTDYCCMLDDDLTFQITNKEHKIVTSTPKQVEAAFTQMIRWLDKGYSHCGMAVRTANYASTELYAVNSRMMHALFYNVHDLRDHGCDFTKGVPRYFSMDDFHMTLQLMEKGIENIVSHKYRISPSASNSSGGASEWRTLESHNKSAQLLGKLHPHAKVVRKHGWQGMDGDRYDVIIHWKKCIKDSECAE